MAELEFKIVVNDSQVMAKLHNIVNEIETTGRITERVGNDMKRIFENFSDVRDIKQAGQAIREVFEQNRQGVEQLQEAEKVYKRLLSETEKAGDNRAGRALKEQINNLQELISYRRKLNEEIQKTNEKIEAGERLEDIRPRIQSLLNISSAFSQLQNEYTALTGKARKYADFLGDLGKITDTLGNKLTSQIGSMGKMGKALKSLTGGFNVLGAAIKKVPGIGWIVAGISAITKVIGHFSNKAKEARRETEEWSEKIASGVAEQIQSFRELQRAFAEVGNSAEKGQEFMSRYATELAKVGDGITTIDQAQKLLVGNGEEYIQYLYKVAEAEAYRALAQEDIKEQIKNERIAQESKAQISTLSPTEKATSMIVSNLNYLSGDRAFKSNLFATYRRAAQATKEYGAKAEEALTKSTELFKEADTAAQKLGIKTKFAADSIKVLEENVSRLQKRYKEASAAEREAIGKELAEAEKKLAEAQGKADSITGSSSTKDSRAEELKEQMELIKSMREFYQQYRQFSGSSERAMESTKGLFSDLVQLPKGLDIEAAILGDYLGVLRAFSKEAESIGNKNLSEKITKEIQAENEALALEVVKAKQTYEELKESREKALLTPSANSPLASIGQVLSTLQQGMAKIDEEERRATEALYKQKAEYVKTYGAEAYKQEEQNLAIGYDKLRERAQKEAEEALQKAGVNISDKILESFALVFKNLTEAGVKQLKKATDAMKKVANKSAGLFDAEELKELKKLFGFAEDKNFWEQLQFIDAEQLSKLDNSTLTETQKGLIKQAQALSKLGVDIVALIKGIDKSNKEAADKAKITTKQATGEMWGRYGAFAQQLGASIGGNFGGIVAGLGGTAQQIGGLVGNWGNLIENGGKAGYMQGIGMLVEGGMQMYNMFASQIRANKQVVKEWNEAISQAAQATRLYAIEQLKYKSANIWAVENPFKRLTDAGKMYDEATKQMADIANEIAEKGKLQKAVKSKISGENVAKGAGAGALIGAGGATIGGIAAGMGAGAALGSAIPVIGTAIGAVVGGIIGLFAKKKTPTYKKLTDVYGQIYNPETYELNQQILNDYAKMDEATKKLIDNWDEIKAKQQEADKEMEESIKDLVGEIDNTLADALEKVFDGADIYEAMDDIENYFNQMIKRMVIKAASAALFEDLLSDFEEAAKKSFRGGSADYDIKDDLLKLKEGIEERMALAPSVLEALKGWFDEVGVDASAPKGAKSGTKGGYTTQMSHEDATEINGRMTDIQMQIRMIVGLLGSWNNAITGGANISYNKTAAQPTTPTTPTTQTNIAPKAEADTSGTMAEMLKSFLSASASANRENIEESLRAFLRSQATAQIEQIESLYRAVGQRATSLKAEGIEGTAGMEEIRGYLRMLSNYIYDINKKADNLKDIADYSKKTSNNTSRI